MDPRVPVDNGNAINLSCAVYRSSTSSMDQSDSVTSFEDQILQDREALRNQVSRLQAEHRIVVERLRADFERSSQDAGTQISGLREELFSERRTNQELLRQQEIQTQKALQAKDALNATEEHNARLLIEKSNLVVLLDGCRAEISDLRALVSRNMLDQQTMSGEVEMLKLKLSGRESEVEFLKISESSLRTQSQQFQSEVSKLHSHIAEKDREITRVRSEGDRRVRDVSKRISALDEEVFQEKQKTSILEDNVRRDTALLSNVQGRFSEVESRKKRLEEEYHTEKATHQRLMADLKEHVNSFKVRNDQLEQEKAVQKRSLEEFEEAYTAAMKEAQEEIDRLNEELDSRNQSMADMTKELEDAREFVAYLKHDSSRTFSTELSRLVEGKEFSVARLYHEYRVAIEKLSELQTRNQTLLEEIQTQSQSRQKVQKEREEYAKTKSHAETEAHRAAAELKSLSTMVKGLEEQNAKYERKLRSFELENRRLTEKNWNLERQLAVVLNAEVDDDDDDDRTDGPSQYRNSQELVQINMSLQSTVEALDKENLSMKEKLEDQSRELETVAKAVSEVRALADQKDHIDKRMRELASEIQLYRMENQNGVLRDFLRTLSENEDQMEMIMSLANDERLMWSFIRAYGGNEAAEKFSVLQNQVITGSNKIESLVVEAQKWKSDFENAVNRFQEEIKELVSERDKALNEAEGIKNGLELVRQENVAKNAEIARQMVKVSELYERLCEHERSHASLTQNLEAQKEATERATAESHAMSLESSSLRSQVAVLTEQQSLLHNALQEKVDMLQALQSNQTQILKELQLSKEKLERTNARPEETAATGEKQRHDATLQMLTEMKKQMDAISSLPRTAAHLDNTSSPSNNAPAPSTSRNLPAGSSDFAMSIIRQSSVQQEQLQHQISELQTRLDKTTSELCAKSKELETLQALLNKKTQDVSNVNSSMLKDLSKVKEERESLRTQNRHLSEENSKLRAEVDRLEEVEKRLKTELQGLNQRCAMELQAHQAILATSAELRKEADDLKHSTGLLKRREHDLARANEELTKSLTEHEARFREEIRLLEEDRDNSRSWKRTLYDRLRPSSAAALPDDVQDLNILVEHQKKENELLTKQLQMAKEDGFSTAAKLRAAQLTISRLQEDLHSSLQGRESGGDASNWHTSYVELQGILSSSLEVNSKLRHDLINAQKEVESAKKASEAMEKKVEANIRRGRELEHANIQLDQEVKSLKEQLDSWNNRFGASQQKSEMDSLKARVTDLEQRLKNEQTKYENLKQDFPRQVKERTASKVKPKDDEIARLQKELESRNNELRELQSRLDAKSGEVAVLNEQLQVLRVEHEAAQKAFSTKLTEAQQNLQSSKEEIARVQELLNQKTEQFNRFIQLRDVEDQTDGNQSVQTEVRASTPVGTLRPIQQSSPTHTSKTTAVVTPQAQTLVSGSTVSQMQQRSGTNVRGSHLPIVAVAPQAQEPTTASVQTATVAPHLTSVQSQTAAVAPSTHRSDLSSADPETSTSTAASTSPATPLSQGMVQSMPTRRRPQMEDDSSEQPQHLQPDRKRQKTLIPKHPLLQFRPPSPTSSDVTSSTTPAASPQISASTAVVTTIGVVEGASQRPRARSIHFPPQEHSESAGASSSQEIQSGQGMADENALNVEERAVDSSDEGIVQDTGPLASVEGTVDMEADVMSSEEQSDEMMDADESGQLMDQGFASASDGWLSAPAGASDDSAQPLASSEADYTERPQEQNEPINRGEDTIGESVSDITSTEVQDTGISARPSEVPSAVVHQHPTDSPHSQLIATGIRLSGRSHIQMVEPRNNTPDVEDPREDFLPRNTEDEIVNAVMEGLDDGREMDDAITQVLTASAVSSGSSGALDQVFGEQQDTADHQIVHASGITPTTGPALRPRLRPAVDATQSRSSPTLHTSSGSPQRVSTRRPITAPGPSDDSSLTGGASSSGPRTLRPLYAPPRPGARRAAPGGYSRTSTRPRRHS